MNCILTRHACFYGDLADTDQIPVYKMLYIQTNIKVKKEINALNGKQNVYFLLHIHIN